MKNYFVKFFLHFQAVAIFLDVSNFALNFCMYFLCSKEFRKMLFQVGLSYYLGLSSYVDEGGFSTAMRYWLMNINMNIQFNFQAFPQCRWPKIFESFSNSTRSTSGSSQPRETAARTISTPVNTHHR